MTDLPSGPFLGRPLPRRHDRELVTGDALTVADLDLTPGPFHPDLATLGPETVQPLLAVNEVRYVGQPVAVVVAETEAAALDAAERVEVGYRVRTPVLTLDAGGAMVDSGWVGSRPDPHRFAEAPVTVALTVVNR
ncbi:MAG: hypothetical protein ACK5RL_19825 [Acidimicrobiales bacterium]